MWTYEVKTGKLSNPAGAFIATCYSGRGEGLNNPAEENVKDVGPIPQGKYTIGTPYVHPVEGPVVMNLEPQEGTNDFGRSAFHIHGDNAELNHTASEGCIITPRFARDLIAASSDRELSVI